MALERVKRAGLRVGNWLRKSADSLAKRKKSVTSASTSEECNMYFVARTVFYCKHVIEKSSLLL